MKFAGRKTLPIGVDLGSSAVKMAQLRLSGSDIELLAAGSVEVPHTCREDLGQRLEFLAGALRRLRKANAFRGRECVLSLPAEAIFLHQIRLPKLPDDRIDKALAEELPYPTNDVILCCEVVGEVHEGAEAKQELIVAAVAQATLDAYLDMANCAKLDVVGIDIEAYAIADCFARQFRQTAGVVLFVDLGASSTQVVLANDNKIVFARNLSTGCEKLDQDVAKALNIPVEEASVLRRDPPQAEIKGSTEDLRSAIDSELDPLINELAQCIGYHEAVFRNGSIQQAIFSGGGAHDTQACKAIAKRLNLRAQVGDPLANIEIAKGVGANAGLDLRDPNPDLAVAVGLSLRAMKCEDTRERPLPVGARN